MQTLRNFLCLFSLCLLLQCSFGDKLIRVDPRMEDAMNPGDVVETFTLDTLSGSFTYTPFNDNSQPAMIFFALDTRSGFNDAMWSNELYVKNLFWRSPNATMYFFLTYDPNANQIASKLQSIFQQTMNDLKYDTNKQDTWNSRVFFCTTPVSKLDNWIPTLLSQWPAVLDQVVINFPSHSLPVKRLDGRWPWTQAIDGVLGTNRTYSISNFGDGCTEKLPTDISGQIALISRQENSSCYWSEKFIKAERAGAVGIIVYSDKDVPLVDINCRKPSCYLTLIPVTMITYEAGSLILQELSNNIPVTVKFSADNVSGYYFAVDWMSELQEMGNIQYPSMSFLAWEAQYFNYYHDLLNKIEASTVPGTQDFVVNVYDETIMDGPTNSSTLTFPAPSKLQGYSQLLLDMDLGCTGPKDSSCPAWDRILQVFICCGEVDSDVRNNGTESYLCEQEIGRWITPFGRRVGRWITDVTPLLPLFASPDGASAPSTQCKFTISCGTTEHWVPSLNLRFHDYKPEQEQVTHLLPLFQGGTFDSSYNSKYKPIEFDIPRNTSKVLLYAVITGHGSDNNNCAEFCVTSHHFQFNNGPTNSITFRNAGTPLGCAHRSSEGVEPNEFGTWLYGRDGWCDGQEVEPWVVDVTDELNMELGASNSVLYFGYYNGATPDPTENPGYIKMFSYLSFYSKP